MIEIKNLKRNNMLLLMHIKNSRIPSHRRMKFNSISLKESLAHNIKMVKTYMAQNVKEIINIKRIHLKYRCNRKK